MQVVYLLSNVKGMGFELLDTFIEGAKEDMQLSGDYGFGYWIVG